MRPGRKRRCKASRRRTRPLSKKVQARLAGWVHAYGGFVFGIIVFMVGRRQAKDLNQEYWLKIAQLLRDGEGPKNFVEPRPWLRKCAVTLVIDWRRSRKREEEQWEAFDELGEDRTSIEPLTAVIQQETLKRAIESLDPLEWTIMERHLAGRSVREIADWLDVPGHRVRYLLQKALSKLDEELGKAEEIWPRRKAQIGKKDRSS
jgi:RNA polymerase sigma factor (sigma-70 family)